MHKKRMVVVGGVAVDHDLKEVGLLFVLPYLINLSYTYLTNIIV